MKLLELGAKVYIAAMIIFIYLPIIVMIILSFSSSSNISFPIPSFSLKWYIEPPKGYEYASYISVLYDWRFWEALRNSAIVSGIAGVLTLFLVTTVALALRHRIVGRNLLFYLFLLGFLIPGVSLGLGVVILYKIMGWEFSLWTVALVDTVYAVPFGLILMMARFDPDLMWYEKTAYTLKAPPLQVFRRVTLPLIQWEAISAGIFGFVLAWSELIRSSFVMKGTGVLSTFILNELSINPVTPKWYAVGTIVTMISIIGLLIFAFTLSKTTSR